MSATLPAILPTIGEIVRRTGEPVHRVEYAIKSRGIKSIGRAGNVRVYSEDQVATIIEALRTLGAQRQGVDR